MITVLMMLAAVPGQGFTWSGELAAGKRLTVKNVIGDVRVEVAAGRTASVEGVRKAGRYGDPEDVVIRQVETADGVTICVLYPPQRNAGGCDHDGDWNGDRPERNDTRVDFVVRLPSGVHLAAATVSGDVVGRGLRSSVDARTVSGDVRLADVEGATLEATTVSGDVELSAVEATELAAETVSGDVDFRGVLRRNGRYELKSLSGDVVMELPAGSGANVSGSTFSGRFQSDFPLTSRASGKYASGKRIEGTIGDGSARLRVESFSGDLALRSRRP
jgi:DUF4097 and DUF4098 domain-containing protein YvlB